MGKPCQDLPFGLWLQILTVGALHRADSAAHMTATSVWHDEFSTLPRPFLAVNIGGPTSNLSMHYAST